MARIDLDQITPQNPVRGIQGAQASPPPSESPQPVTFSPTQDMPPYDASVPGSYNYVGDGNGDYAQVVDGDGNVSYVYVGEGQGDYDLSPKMYSTIDSYGDRSVMDKTNNFLEWMQANPSNTNGAEVFLLYLSELDQAGVFDENPELAEYILSIEDSNGKSLVEECVDITMMQMCMNGSTPQEAHDTIYALFPPPTDGSPDPIGDAVRAEADAELAAINESYDEETGTYTLIPTSQLQLEEEWGAFITDSVTTTTMNAAQKNIQMDTIGMIQEGSPDPYSALLNTIMWLMLLLSTQATIRVNGYGETLDWLSGVSEDLTEITTGWTDGFDVEDGDEWATYSNGGYVYVDENGDYVARNEKNEWQKVDEDGNLLYTDSNGNTVYLKDGVYYNESNGTVVTNQDEPGYVVTPQMGAISSGKTANQLTVNEKLAYDWMNEVQDVQAEVNDSPLLNQSTKDSFNEQCEIINNQQAVIETYEYQDKNGNSVSPSGQAEDEDGYLLYQTYDKNGNVVQTLYYNPDDGKYYVEGSNPPQENPGGVGDGGQGTPQPVYYDSNGNLTKDKNKAAGGNHRVATGEYENAYVNANGQPVNENGQLITMDGEPLFKDTNGDIVYEDSNGNYFYANGSKADQPVPYNQQGSLTPDYGSDPTHSSNELTLHDQAYGYTDENGVHHAADPEGLQTSLEAISDCPIPGEDENGQVIGDGYGPSTQNLAISNALSAMAKLITDQSSTITTQISQETNNIQLYLQSFSQILLDDSASYTSSVANSVNGQTPR